MSKEAIARFIRRECIMYPEKGRFFLGKMAGSRYASQFYMSNLLYEKDMMWNVAKEFQKIVEEKIGHWDFQLAGQEWSSIPLLSGLPIMLDALSIASINSFMVKRKRKSYGVHNWYEGRPNDLPVLIVDDLLNSSTSFAHCHDVCTKELGLPVLPFVFAVLNKYSYPQDDDCPEYYDRYLGRDFEALSIVTKDDLQCY